MCVKRLAPDRVEITIDEGRKWQVRWTLDAVGHPVVSLERVRLGPLWLGKLEEGEHRRADRGRDRRATGPTGAPPMRLIALRGATMVEANEGASTCTPPRS